MSACEARLRSGDANWALDMALGLVEWLRLRLQMLAFGHIPRAYPG